MQPLKQVLCQIDETGSGRMSYHDFYVRHAWRLPAIVAVKYFFVIMPMSLVGHKGTQKSLHDTINRLLTCDSQQVAVRSDNVQWTAAVSGAHKPPHAASSLEHLLHTGQANGWGG